MLTDLRFAFRMLAKSPGFTAVVVPALAPGVGANTALFSVMDAMLLKALPVEHPEQFVELVRVKPGCKRMNLPYCVFERLKDDRTVLAGLLAYWEAGRTFRAQGESERVATHQVSGAFFTTLGATLLACVGTLLAVTPAAAWVPARRAEPASMAMLNCERGAIR
jgi:hypothetical protein